jgi:hypothetical protein
VTTNTFGQSQSKGGSVKKQRQPKPARLSKSPSSIRSGEYPAHHATAGNGPGIPKVKKGRRPTIAGKTPKDHGHAVPKARAAHRKASVTGKRPSKTVLEQRSRNPRRKSD